MFSRIVDDKFNSHTFQTNSVHRQHEYSFCGQLLAHDVLQWSALAIHIHTVMTFDSSLENLTTPFRTISNPASVLTPLCQFSVSELESLMAQLSHFK